MLGLGGGTPAPTCSVQNAVMTSAAVLFSVVMERMAASIQDCFAVPLFDGGGDHAGAERLGEQQAVARLRAAVGEDCGWDR